MSKSESTFTGMSLHLSIFGFGYPNIKEYHQLVSRCENEVNGRVMETLPFLSIFGFVYPNVKIKLVVSQCAVYFGFGYPNTKM
jgi:hypothetical protein